MRFPVPSRGSTLTVLRAAAAFAPHETLLIGSLLAGAAILVTGGGWVPGTPAAAGTFVALAILAVAFRTAAAQDGRRARFWDAAASFWLMPVVGIAHTQMGPFVQAFHPVLEDAALAAADQQLFGVHLSILLEPYLSGVLTDVLLVCYYSYFVLPLGLGILLFRSDREAYERYLFALTLFYAFLYTSYVVTPAIGPRFFLAGAYVAPLQGAWLTPWLDGWMRLSPYVMDCFPSGHTGATLIMFAFAARYDRRYLGWTLLPGLGLIAATVLARFHYTVDLIACVPLVMLCCSVGLLWNRAPSQRSVRAAPPVPVHARV